MKINWEVSRDITTSTGDWADIENVPNVTHDGNTINFLVSDLTEDAFKKIGYLIHEYLLANLKLFYADFIAVHSIEDSERNLKIKIQIETLTPVFRQDIQKLVTKIEKIHSEL